MVLVRVAADAPSVRLGDVDVPAAFAAEWVNQPGWPCAVALDVIVDPDHGAVPVGVHTITEVGQRPISAISGLKLLRQVGAAPFLTRLAVAHAAANLAHRRAMGRVDQLPGGALDDAIRAAATDVFHSTAEAALHSAGRRSRRVLTDAFLAEIAEVYQSAIEDGEPPLNALMRTFCAEKSTVNRWCHIARQRGILAPSRPPKGRS